MAATTKTSKSPSLEELTSPAIKARMAEGKELRAQVPRSAHAAWVPPADRPDPVDVLTTSSDGRLENLVPIRYGRMLKSPFTFLRGSALQMAMDLSSTPATGLQVQACGDCHLANFGLFATPERRLIFDINDFDETIPGPWEWDVKRLAASVVVAGRDIGVTEDQARHAAVSGVGAYREKMRGYAVHSPLDVWYERIEAETLVNMGTDDRRRKMRQQLVDQAHKRVIEHAFPKMTEHVGGGFRIVDQPPLIFHIADQAADWEERVRIVLDGYRESLPEDRRLLYDRYSLADVAFKVVGVGSVGTRAFVALFLSQEGYPLFLQVKEARASVLAAFVGGSQFDNDGTRVVVGQRIMQSASDIFLGWSHGKEGFDFYVRQLRDMKMSATFEDFDPVALVNYSMVCGWALAAAHARSGDPAKISGYLGNGDTFDQAVGDFAQAYADQTERDHAAARAAAAEGRFEVLDETE